MKIDAIISEQYAIDKLDYKETCKSILDKEGVLVLPEFITDSAISMMKSDGNNSINDAYFCSSNHNVYLTAPDDTYGMEHPRNREVISSKGLIGDDQLHDASPLKTLYRDKAFQSFIADVLGEDALYPYADPLSAVNVHYAKEGQELGWHFDNSSFAITLLIDKPIAGGDFEYLKDLRNADAGEYNFEGVREVLDSEVEPSKVSMESGTLVLFRGRNSLHRVTPTIGDKTRMLAVLAYNSEPGVELSESARMIFYGRLA